MKKYGFLFLLFLLNAHFVFSQVKNDSIFLVDKTIIEANIVEISELSVFYHEVSGSDSIKSTRLSSVWKIRYSNGFEDVFNEVIPDEVVAAVPPSENAVFYENQTLPAEEDEEIELAEDFLGDEEKSGTYPKVRNLLKKIALNVDNRPTLAFYFGLSSPIMVGDDTWTNTDFQDGLGFRFGGGAEAGFEFNPHQLFGISLVKGFTYHKVNLSVQDASDPENDITEVVDLQTKPVTLKLKFYPMDGLALNGGLVFNNLNISNSSPSIEKVRSTGFSFGVSRFASIGRNKNSFEFSMNYTRIPIGQSLSFSLDPALTNGAVNSLMMGNLNYVDIKIGFQIGIIR
jgi:hypothetical protein